MYNAKKKNIYVIGHKNPDTDSICSAIAYADIQNRTAQVQNYIPKRAGQINEETQYVLEHFGVDAPGYLANVGTQVKDMDIHESPHVDRTFSLRKVWEIMNDNYIVCMPIRNRKGELEGVVTNGDIARVYMETEDSYLLSKAKTRFRRIAETIEGTIVVGNPEAVFSQGKVLIGASGIDQMKEHVKEHDLVLLGNREESQIQALESGAGCLVICLGSDITDRVKELAEERKAVIILASQDTFTVARLINQSIPVEYVMKTTDLVTFNTDDFTDDIQEVMIRHRHRAFPVINKKGVCIGTISRRNFMDMHKKQVILVDHNEKDQAVDNIDKAEILAIVDHHKLGRLETMKPVMFRNHPVGCTATILYEIYGEQRLEIHPTIAGLLCAAIISDTLMFRSPTCTLRDKMAAGALALIADIDIPSFAKAMFSAGSNLKKKTSQEIFFQDYKKFIAEGGIYFGVGQISSMDNEELRMIREKLSPFAESECGKSVPSIYFMLTNIIEETTYLLYFGEKSRDLVEAAFHVEPTNGMFVLPGVVSRKKQLIPALMETAQYMSNEL